LGKNIKFLMF